MSSRTSVPACSVPGCVDTADLLVSGPYQPRVFLCVAHGRHVRAILSEVLVSGARVIVDGGHPSGATHTT